MQNAARVVSIENQRLRELLALRGVSQAEILQYLALPQQAAPTAGAGARSIPKAVASSLQPSNPPSRSRTPRPPSSTRSQSEAATSNFSVCHRSSQSPLSPSSPGASHCPIVTNSPRREDAPAPAAATTTPRAPLARIAATPSATHSPGEKYSCSTQGAENCYLQSCGPGTGDQGGTHDTILPPVSDCFCPQDASEAKETEGLETACDTAAEILVQLHRRPDREQARAALGCVGNGPCSVKNTTIFKLMDEF